MSFSACPAQLLMLAENDGVQENPEMDSGIQFWLSDPNLPERSVYQAACVGRYPGCHPDRGVFLPGRKEMEDGSGIVPHGEGRKLSSDQGHEVLGNGRKNTEMEKVNDPGYRAEETE